jgi:hypothetical protein
MGIVTVLLLGADVWKSRAGHRPFTMPGLALATVVVVDLAFFVSYRFDPAVPNYGFSAVYLAEYPLFVSLMLAAFWGWHTLILGEFIPLIAGAALLGISIAVLAYHGRRLAHKDMYSDPASLVIVVLITFSLLFCFATAVGRISLGLHQAQVSRYLTLMIPAYLGWYFHLLSIGPGKMRQPALSALMLMSVVGSLPTGIVEAQAQRMHDNKMNWRRCYLHLEDVEKCDVLTGVRIFPETEGIPAKMAYLKAHHLNLYADAER